ncbi:Uncharacterised protein [uncultured archaeon]|nr:Uncharacterised protein [uncultured archaeon]
MTTNSIEIIQVCRKCYCDNGFGSRLTKRGNEYVCELDHTHRYAFTEGEMKKLP